jgi:16S rRNA G966 N2-methylase RsmD
MCGLIESNLDLCKIPEDVTEVVQAEAAAFLKRTESRTDVEPWDIAYFDPPYATDYLPVLESLGKESSTLLAEDGLLIVEHHHKNLLKGELGRLIRTRTLKQGDSALSFYK